MSIITIKRVAERLRRDRAKEASTEDILIEAIRTVPAFQVAHAIDISEQHICDIRKGRRRIGAVVLEKLGRL